MISGHFKTGIPWFLLLLSLCFIAYLTITINDLKTERKKREIAQDDVNIFVPLYAQLTRENLHRICMKKMSKYGLVLESNTVEEKVQTSNRKLVEKRKKCTSELKSTEPQVIATRPVPTGCALSSGQKWFICEMNHGYSILPYASTKMLNVSEPDDVIMLPYPFDGTNNAIVGSTLFYSHHDRIVAYNMKSKKSNLMRIDADLDSIYNSSTSRYDIQTDEHGLWVLYRKHKSVTVSKINESNLKIHSNWTLAKLDENICATFIKCAILHGIYCDSEGSVRVKPLYDFFSNIYITGKEIEWKGVQGPSNVQYDHKFHRVNIFTKGRIYTVLV